MPAVKLAEIKNVPVLKAGWSTITDRFYPKSALVNIARQFTPGLGDFIFSGDETSLYLDLANCSHRTNKLYLKNGDTELWAEVHILDTRCGRLVSDFMKTNNVRFDVFMLGRVNKYNEVKPESVQYVRVGAFGKYK